MKLVRATRKGINMELTIALAISILSVVMTVVNFALNRKDKSNKDAKDDSYKLGQIETKLSNIEKTLEKIENKLDSYDREIDERIKNAIEHHVREYHKG